MIDYLSVFIAVVLLALQFSCNKVYQKQMGAAVFTSLLFMCLTSVCTVLIFFPVNGFRVTWTPFSVAMALGSSLVVSLYQLLGFKAFALGKMSVFTLFLMLGGMTLPYIYGVLFLDEELNAWRVAGLLLMVFSLLLPLLDAKKDGQKIPKVFLLLCLGAFVLNGFTSIFSKMHQIESTLPTVDTPAFVLLSSLIKIVLFLPIMAIMYIKEHKKGHRQSAQAPKPSVFKVVLAILCAAAFGGVSSLLQLNSASNLPAVVLYSMVTGGSVVLTDLASRLFFKEKTGKWATCGILLSFVATVLFVF
ncbi:MAG: EamA family transporter [Clostridia bacterium]|nr:EamA family transporter [Clostridia bacterium]